MRLSNELSRRKEIRVLILVLKEYALRVFAMKLNSLEGLSVLILVLKEYALREQKKYGNKKQEGVLILVLKEDAL